MTSEEYGQEAFIRGDSDDISYDAAFAKHVAIDGLPLVIAMVDWEIGYNKAHLAKLDVDSMLERIMK